MGLLEAVWVTVLVGEGDGAGLAEALAAAVGVELGGGAGVSLAVAWGEAVLDWVRLVVGVRDKVAAVVWVAVGLGV